MPFPRSLKFLSRLFPRSSRFLLRHFFLPIWFNSASNYPAIHPSVHSATSIHPPIHPSTHPYILRSLQDNKQKTINNIKLPTNWSYGRLSHARGPPARQKSLREFKPRQRLSRTTTINKLQTHTANQPYIQPAIKTIHPPVHSPIHLIQPSIHPSTQPNIHSSTHPNNLRPSVHPTAYPASQSIPYRQRPEASPSTTGT